MSITGVSKNTDPAIHLYLLYSFVHNHANF